MDDSANSRSGEALEGISAQLDEHLARLAALDLGLQELAARAGPLAGRFDELDARLVAIDARCQRIEELAKRFEGQLTTLTTRLQFAFEPPT